MTAALETHEIIPENLSPPSTGHSRQPSLIKTHAEHRSAYVNHTCRLAFSLDIPSDATPAFGLNAGQHGEKGGLEWRVRLAYLVVIPRRGKNGTGVSMIGVGDGDGDGDNEMSCAATSLAPMMNVDGGWEESRCETVECEIPIRVLAGNTAFLVRPSVHVV